MPRPKTLVTGVAGFIGSHVAERLLAKGESVYGIDNLNSYYDPGLKRARIHRIAPHPNFEMAIADIANRVQMEELFARESFGTVIHLAAQAGVRHSVENPHVYAEANLTGFLNILEGVRRSGVAHLVYASSSSVYGGNNKIPFSIADRVDQPVSLYAVTKRANELMAHCYAHLYNINATGLRFFTVYGPWGRPDMAPFLFARAISRGEPIDVYNHGRMWRDFTYIDDIAEGVVRIAMGAPRGNRLFNVGNSQPVELLAFIQIMEQAFGRPALKRFLPMQPGDVMATHADVDDFWRATGFRPSTPLETGIQHFARWYKDYYGEANHEHGIHARARAVLQTS
jgi:UDP-glucuronate 4-epimerase